MSRKTRKLMWSVPLVATLAIVGALAAFIALAPNDAQAQGLQTPGQVQDVTLEATGPTSLKLKWNAPDPGDGGRPTGYRIDVSDDGLTWELLEGSWPSQDDEYEHTSLLARHTKYYRIFAHNTGGTKIGPVAFPTPSFAATEASTKPGNPTGVTATRGKLVTYPPGEAATTSTRTEITVRWDEPETPDGTKIYQYRVAFAPNPADLGLDQARTLTVVDVPTTAVDEVYCGHTGSANGGLACVYTFTKLLEHQVWHYQVYAVNEDATGEVGTSNPSDSKSATTDDGTLPSMPLNLWSAVNKSSTGIWLEWKQPRNPAGAPVTDYLIQGRPMTDIDNSEVGDEVTTETDVDWGNDSSNAIIFHDGKTADLLLTESELRRAGREAWTADDRLEDPGADPNTEAPDQDLHYVEDFDEYFVNLQWEFRVFALNRVWEREVDDVSEVYNLLLGDHIPALTTALTATAFPLLAGNFADDRPNNVSRSLHVSRNELDVVDDMPTPAAVNIASTRVDLQHPPTKVSAMRDNETNGGRTKIDLEWMRSYSHMLVTDTDRIDEVSTPQYALRYRIQWSNDPDASAWNLLDSDGDPGNGHQDFDAEVNNGALCDDITGMCDASHSIPLTAGVKYTYRIFAANEPPGGTGAVNAHVTHVGPIVGAERRRRGHPLGVQLVGTY